MLIDDFETLNVTLAELTARKASFFCCKSAILLSNNYYINKKRVLQFQSLFTLFWFRFNIFRNGENFSASQF